MSFPHCELLCLQEGQRENTKCSSAGGHTGLGLCPPSYYQRSGVETLISSSTMKKNVPKNEYSSYKRGKDKSRYDSSLSQGIYVCS